MPFYVKVETCPRCGSRNTENMVRVEPGLPVKIYVRCSECKEFVARYTLERYTSDKPYESLLDIYRHCGCSIASRTQAHELEGFTECIRREFDETCQAPPSLLKVEEMITESEKKERKD